MYKTQCPACNEDDCLYVVGGVFSAVGMNLYSDGFSFGDAQQVSTEDEAVRCSMCDRLFTLDDLYTDEPPKPKGKMKLKGD